MDGTAALRRRNLHDSLQEIQQQAKDADSPDPVSLDKVTMRNLLEKSGASPEDMHAFDQSFEENAGEKGTLMLSNVCNSRKFEVHTPDVTVTVSPDRTDLVRTQIIDGRECWSARRSSTGGNALLSRSRMMCRSTASQ